MIFLVSLTLYVSRKESFYYFRYTNLLNILRTRNARFGTNTFTFQVAKLWNVLPEAARKIADFNSFKVFIQRWNGYECKSAISR